MDPRAKAEKILTELDYDFRSFTIESFIRWVGGLRGREIYSTPWEMPAGMFGVWISGKDFPSEYIFYRSTAPPIHQIHIQVHELAHVLLGHPTLRLSRKEIVAALQGEIDLPFDDVVLLRSTKKSEIEREAETLASLIQEKVIHHLQLNQLTKDISSDDKLARFARDMGLV